MATYKASFPKQLSVFDRESHPATAFQGEALQSAEEKYDNKSRDSRRETEAGIERVPPLAGMNEMVPETWETLMAHRDGSHPTTMGQVFCSVSGSSGKGTLVNVVKEVFKREMMNIIGKVLESRFDRNGAVGRSEEHQSEINSLNRRLREMTAKAVKAEEMLKLERKEKYYMQFDCEDLEAKNKRLSTILHQTKAEKENLLAELVSVADENQHLKSENERLRNAKNESEVEALRAQQEAEMVHLVASQASLQTLQLEKQLKESHRSANMITQQVEELQRVQYEIGTLFTSALEESQNGIGTQIDSLVKKSSKALQVLGAKLNRRSPGAEADDEDRAQEEGDGLRAGGTNGLSENAQGTQQQIWVNRDGSPAESGRGIDENQHGILRKLTRRFKRNEAHGGEHGSAEARESRPGMLSRLRNIAYRASRRNFDVRNANGEQSTSPGRFRRIVSLGLSRLRQKRHQENETLANTAASSFDALLCDALRGVVECRQKEVNRLRGELQAATVQADTFEQRLRKEQHQRLFVKNKLVRVEAELALRKSAVDEDLSGRTC